jgi:hypothetical protein
MTHYATLSLQSAAVAYAVNLPASISTVTSRFSPFPCGHAGNYRRVISPFFRIPIMLSQPQLSFRIEHLCIGGDIC